MDKSYLSYVEEQVIIGMNNFGLSYANKIILQAKLARLMPALIPFVNNSAIFPTNKKRHIVCLIAHDQTKICCMTKEIGLVNTSLNFPRPEQSIFATSDEILYLLH